MNNNSSIMVFPYAVSGVYGAYPGLTYDPQKREREHTTALRNGTHFCDKLQTLVQEHGIEAFQFICFDPVPLAEGAKAEQKLLNEAANDGLLVNKQKKSTKVHPFGYKLSKKTRRRQSRAKQGNKNAAGCFVLTSADGRTHETNCLADFCKQHALDASCLSNVASGRARHHRGWRAIRKD